MKTPDFPPDEAQRVAALHALRILDTAPEERFDRFTRLARRLFGVPIALVSLVDTGRQWFKSRQGLDATETSREVSFCGHAILGADTFVVPDAHEDERFADNPLVTGDPNVRFYAGCPLKGPTGHKLGTLCLIDREPKELDSDELALLADLSRMIEDDLAALALATTDELTGLSNRRGFELIARNALAVCRRAQRPASLLFIDLDHFKAVNDTHGHAVGDVILQETGALLLDTFRDSDVVARLGGDEFCVLLTGVGDGAADVPIERLQNAVAKRNAGSSDGPDIALSVGAVRYVPERHSDLDALLAEADKLMYAHKRAHR